MDYKGYSISIEPDHDPVNPVEDWDHVATFVSPSNDYASWGSMPENEVEDLYDTDGTPTVQDFERYFREELGARVVLRVWKFEHSGVAFKATRMDEGNPFSCRWDSGMFGFVYDTPEAIRKCWGDTVPTDEQIEAGLKGMVESYSAYAAGEVVGYTIESPDDESWCGDSCWGFYSDEDAISEAKAAIDSHIEYLAREDAKVSRCMAL